MNTKKRFCLGYSLYHTTRLTRDGPHFGDEKTFPGNDFGAVDRLCWCQCCVGFFRRRRRIVVDTKDVMNRRFGIAIQIALIGEKVL